MEEDLVHYPVHPKTPEREYHQQVPQHSIALEHQSLRHIENQIASSAVPTVRVETFLLQKLDLLARSELEFALQ